MTPGEEPPYVIDHLHLAGPENGLEPVFRSDVLCKRIVDGIAYGNFQSRDSLQQRFRKSDVPEIVDGRFEVVPVLRPIALQAGLRNQSLKIRYVRRYQAAGLSIHRLAHHADGRYRFNWYIHAV